MKRKLLLVGDYNRNDFIYVAKLLAKDVEFYFIEFLNKKELKNNDCLQYGKVIYWKDYKSAYDLLEKLKPEKVIFYFIESYNHVALNVACKVNQITTYHLEHGLRFSLAYYELGNNSVSVEKQNVSFPIRLNNISNSLDKFKNRQFYKNTILKSPKEERLFLEKYFSIRSCNSIIHTFKVLKNILRLPDQYISFSPIIFNYHKELEELADNYPVNFIGIPQFDDFVKWKHLKNSGSNILFIDQPLHEQPIYGWSKEGKIDFLQSLSHCVTSLGRKLFIKPHPLNDISIYHSVKENSMVELIHSEWDNVVTDINTVLGFSSTLLLPFMAMDHICCFTWEQHPVMIDEPYSQFLINSNACNAVFNFDELKLNIQNRDHWYPLQKSNKDQFVKKYMYKFDGKSSDRLKDILLSEVS